MGVAIWNITKTLDQVSHVLFQCDYKCDIVNDMKENVKEITDEI